MEETTTRLAASFAHGADGLRRAFAALRYPNYRLWFFGQLPSLLGSWMQITAQGYLVFELTRSPAYLGYVSFAAGLPSWLLMLYGGVVADRMSKRTLLVVTQAAMMALAAILAAITLLGVVRPLHIIMLAFGLGIANAFEAPARQAFVLEMVDREDLTNAIALNSTMFNAAVALGPALAGLVYAWVGPGYCFAINAVSYLAVIVAFLRMRLPPHSPPSKVSSRLDDLREGLVYVGRHGNIRALVLTLGMTTVLNFSFVTLIPAWAVNVLRGDEVTNGWLQSARGLGALAGALTIAALGRFRSRGKLLLVGALVSPAMLIAFSFARDLWLALACLVVSGVGLIFVFNMLNALVQLESSDELRGRVMGVYSLTFFGLAPLGALLAGSLAERMGEPNAVVLCAAAALAGAGLIFGAFPRLRRL